MYRAGAGAQASVMTPFAIAVFVMTLNSSAVSHGAEKASSGGQPILLGVEGYALTSLEVALATAPRRPTRGS